MSDQSKTYIQQLVNLTKKNLLAIGWETLVIDNTVKKLISIPTDATYALVVVESTITTPAIRYLELGGAGTQPSTTVGIPRSNLDAFDIQGAENIRNFRATRIAAGTHSVSVQYYK